LGQALYSVWKDKLYKKWGYEEFEAYARKEVGIRNETAQKLLRSYTFLEKEEPAFLRKEHNETLEARVIPTYEAVDVLRQAEAKKDKGLGKEGYSKIRKYVLTDGKDAKEAKKEMAAIVKDNNEGEEGEVNEDRQNAIIVKRFLTLLKGFHTAMSARGFVSREVIKETAELIKKIEEELS
jgi:hypothetical protein